MIFNIFEILDIILMTAVLGFLFHDLLPRPRAKTPRGDALVNQYRNVRRKIAGMEWHSFLWACSIVLPSILFHEFAHKFMGMAFGATSIFHAGCSTAYLAPGGIPFIDALCGITIIAMVLKLIGLPVFLIVPGYVTHPANLPYVQEFLIALAGPLTNGIFWAASALILKHVKKLSNKQRAYLFIFRRINGFLFIFNMIPFPLFDGWAVYTNLFHMLFG